MANTKISALTSATTPVAGTEVLPIVQGGATKQLSIANLRPGLGTIPTTQGGTGLTSFTANGVVYANSTSSLNTSSDFTYTAGGVVLNFSAGTARNGFSMGGTTTNWNRYYLSNTGGDAFLGVDASVAVFGGDAYAGVVGTTGSTSLGLATAGVTKFKVDAGGNLIPTTAAKGVNFTANTPAAGMTSQLLNWYEEGTFTPNFTGLTVVGTPTYTGRYTRVGRVVYFSVRIQSTTTTASTVGVTVMTGFPFVIATGENTVLSAINNGTLATLPNGAVSISGGSTTAYLPTWSATADVVLSGFYTV
jgi:hypothetical protein